MTTGCSVTLLAEIEPIHWLIINQKQRLYDKVIVVRANTSKKKVMRRQSQVQPAQAINYFGSGTG
ncbi:MAG: hypothetical protein DMF37_12215 [Verrucomicrobia bacterium]|nr:MAG: hypothetical protein DMF37_12215 [Verrucomicrobiota bacterium]